MSLVSSINRIELELLLSGTWFARNPGVPESNPSTTPNSAAVTTLKIHHELRTQKLHTLTLSMDVGTSVSKRDLTVLKSSQCFLHAPETVPSCSIPQSEAQEL